MFESMGGQERVINYLITIRWVWESPLEIHIKINVDGFTIDNLVAWRNSLSNWLYNRFYTSLTPVTNLHAELYALTMSLILTLKRIPCFEN